MIFKIIYKRGRKELTFNTDTKKYTYKKDVPFDFKFEVKKDNFRATELLMEVLGFTEDGK